MKTKIKVLLTTYVVVFTVFLLGCNNSIPVEDLEHAFRGFNNEHQFESLNGSSEFYFILKSDNRLWHVINKYNTFRCDNEPGYNMSSYTFSFDSVSVVNEFVGVPILKARDQAVLGPVSGLF